MPRGDVGVLKRIERAGRRADKASKRLITALAKTGRNKRMKPPILVTAPIWPALSFSMNNSVICSTDIKTASRRLHRAKDGKRRVFSVCEVLEGLDETLCLLAMPRRRCATPQALADAVCKTEGASFRMSSSRVLVFCTGDATEICTGESSSTHVFLRKMTTGDGGCLLYASAETPIGDSSPPRVLGLSLGAFLRVQKSAAAAIGARLSGAPEQVHTHAP